MSRVSVRVETGSLLTANGLSCQWRVGFVFNMEGDDGEGKSNADDAAEKPAGDQPLSPGTL